MQARSQSLGSFTNWLVNALISGVFPAPGAFSDGASSSDPQLDAVRLNSVGGDQQVHQPGAGQIRRQFDVHLVEAGILALRNRSHDWYLPIADCRDHASSGSSTVP